MLHITPANGKTLTPVEVQQSFWVQNSRTGDYLKLRDIPVNSPRGYDLVAFFAPGSADAAVFPMGGSLAILAAEYSLDDISDLLFTPVISGEIYRTEIGHPDLLLVMENTTQRFAGFESERMFQIMYLEGESQDGDGPDDALTYNAYATEYYASHEFELAKQAYFERLQSDDPTRESRHARPLEAIFRPMSARIVYYIHEIGSNKSLNFGDGDQHYHYTGRVVYINDLAQATTFTSEQDAYDILARMTRLGEYGMFRVLTQVQQ